MSKKLFLIDGSSYFFRAYYAFTGLSNSAGLPTNASLGFTNMLLKVLQDHQPDYVAVIFDPKGPTFRKEIYPEYKANRDAMPTDLAVQIPFMKEIVRAQRIVSLEQTGFEADDLIATLVKRFAPTADLEITVVSGDKDLLQLVGGGVTLLDTMRDKRFGPGEVEEKFGVPPEQLIDVLALAGDASDNIPGVPGFGVKTAAGLIQEFHGLENLIAHADEVKGKGKADKIKTFADQARLSRRLVQLQEDVPLDCDLEALVRREPDWEALAALYRKLEFRQHLAKLPISRDEKETEISTAGLSRDGYRMVTNLVEIERVLHEIREKRLPLAVDLETTSRVAMAAKIVGCSLCWEKSRPIYVPLAHLETAVKQPPIGEFLRLLKPVLEDERVPKRGQNLKYDDVIFRRHGIALRKIDFDAMLASYLLEAEQRGEHNLDALARKYLQHEKISYEQITEGIPDGQFALVPPEKAMLYSGEDVDCVLQLETAMMPLIRKFDLEKLLLEVELPLSSVLAKMESVGIGVDREQLESLSNRFQKELKSLTQEVYRIAGEEFTINSPKQLQVILFEKLNLPKTKKTKTGFSTDTEVLETLAPLHDLPRLLLRYRLLAKLKNTYVDALPELIHPETGRIHTQYQQAVAATGRLSSQNPNLQNIPIREEEGQLIRAAFIPKDDDWLLASDYSQIELRLFAHFSEDPTLLAAYRQGEDIHALTAAAIGNQDVKQVADEMRRHAKTVNFGILYGMSDFGLARQLNVSREEAGVFIARYFERYPGVRRFLDETIRQAHACGYVSTYLGRRRYFPHLKSGNHNERKAAERAAASTRIQGSAADLIKVAMLQVDSCLEQRQLKSRLLLQVHDELVLEVAPDEIETVQALVKEAMTNIWPLRVPLEVETHLGRNWLEAH